MGKKDLSSIQIKTEKVLPQETGKSLLEDVAIKPKKSQKELDNVILSIKITQSEMDIIQGKKEENAGRLAPLGTYVKEYLRTKTDLFSKNLI